jgi:signal transduction histidine kinase
MRALGHESLATARDYGQVYGLMPPISDLVERDLAAIGRISAVPTILRTMRALTGLRVTMIARVTGERWLACAVHDEIEFGLNAGSELDVATTLCSEVRDTRKSLVIDHASADPLFKDHECPKLYKFESYVAVPIFRRNGEYFGNICGLDPEPRNLRDGKTLATLELFSELISIQLEVEEHHEISRAELQAQREASKLREQFIAVLGHDVRNPLASIMVGTELLLGKTNHAADRRVLERVQSSSRRINALVNDLLDLARGRLGAGISLELSAADDLTARLAHVVAEVQGSHPSRSIHLDAGAPPTVRCDPGRIEQLLSNLLANAVEHGEGRTPITVSVGGDERTFALAVVNEGAPISEEKLPRLFEPYFRGGQSGAHNGLGLGLYIAMEIAKAHGGNIAVTSSASRTSFEFTMPREASKPGADGPLHPARQASEPETATVVTALRRDGVQASRSPSPSR